MLRSGVLCLALGASLLRGPGTTPAPSPQSPGATRAPLAWRAPAADTAAVWRLGPRAPSDTPRARPRVIEVSDWYSRRLTIHRYLAYSVVPIFAVQSIAGQQLYREGRDAPTWVKSVHRGGATMLAGIFTVNTITGLWNLWDSRDVKQERALRTIHALSMLTADAGFTYAGAKLATEAQSDFSKRRLHRTIALSSMGLTLVSALAMKLYNR